MICSCLVSYTVYKCRIIILNLIHAEKLHDHAVLCQYTYLDLNLIVNGLTYQAISSYHGNKSCKKWKHNVTCKCFLYPHTVKTNITLLQAKIFFINMFYYFTYFLVHITMFIILLVK